MENNIREFTCNDCQEVTKVDWSKVRPDIDDGTSNIEIYEKGNKFAYYGECENCGNLVEIEPPVPELIVDNVDVSKDGISVQITDTVTNRSCWIDAWKDNKSDEWEYDFNQYIFHLDNDNDIVAKMFQEDLSNYAEDVFECVMGAIDDHEDEYNKLQENKAPTMRDRLKEAKAGKARGMSITKSQARDLYNWFLAGDESVGVFKFNHEIETYRINSSTGTPEPIYNGTAEYVIDIVDFMKEMTPYDIKNKKEGIDIVYNYVNDEIKSNEDTSLTESKLNEDEPQEETLDEAINRAHQEEIDAINTYDTVLSKTDETTDAKLVEMIEEIKADEEDHKLLLQHYIETGEALTDDELEELKNSSSDADKEIKEEAKDDPNKYCALCGKEKEDYEASMCDDCWEKEKARLSKSSTDKEIKEEAKVSPDVIEYFGMQDNTDEKFKANVEKEYTKLRGKYPDKEMILNGDFGTYLGTEKATPIEKGEYITVYEEANSKSVKTEAVTKTEYKIVLHCYDDEKPYDDEITGTFDNKEDAIRAMKSSAIDELSGLQEDIGDEEFTDQYRLGTKGDKVIIYKGSDVLTEYEVVEVNTEIQKTSELSDIEIIENLEGGELIITDVADWDKVIAIASDLSRSQGFYGRLLRDMKEAEEDYGGKENLPFPITM